MADPTYSEIIPRHVVESLAKGSDEVATWALEMISSADEEEVFLRGARVFFQRYGQSKRRQALTYLAATFGADRAELKRYQRFKGLVNLMD